LVVDFFLSATAYWTSLSGNYYTHNPALPLNYKNIVLLENILDVSLEVAWLA